MDRDFMCFFYRNILPERTEVAVQGNIPYHTQNTARPGRRCSGFCGHRKILSDFSQKRHRNGTGIRAGKRNTPKVDFVSAFGVFFRFYGMEAFRRNAQPASGGCNLEKGLGSFPTSIFARGREDTEQKSRLGTRSPCLLQLCWLQKAHSQ